MRKPTFLDDAWRFICRSSLAVACLSAIVISGWALSAPRVGTAADQQASHTDGLSNRRQPKTPRRLREGAHIESQRGYFRLTSGTAEFVADNGMELGGLPNLSLQRIMAELKTTDSPEKMVWSVSGTVTEFNGKNYLLVTRAVHKSILTSDASGF